MNRDEALALADKILALINSQPRTPRREEIASLIEAHQEVLDAADRLAAAAPASVKPVDPPLRYEDWLRYDDWRFVSGPWFYSVPPDGTH